jgi:hypothetical protein
VRGVSTRTDGSVHHRVGLLALAALGLGACSVNGVDGPDEVSKAQVQRESAEQLAKEVDQPVPDVTCPHGLRAKEGATVDCVLVAQGETDRYAVHIVVDSVDGDDVHFDIKVADAPLADGEG